MNIAFFTEMEFTGKVPRSHPNMRTEFAWMAALNADHYNLTSRPNKSYDLGIVIIPKKNPDIDISLLKGVCNEIAVMQEGPHWLFQDYPLESQIRYFNNLTSADIIYTHNMADLRYYKGITDHQDVRMLPTLMIEDPIGDLQLVERRDVLIGGNFVHWYGGFDSYIVASTIRTEVYAPSMGRKKEHEDQLVKHLPYMNWRDWIHKLNEFKIGVHMMRTHAAGTFALNCAYLGIPCIGYEGLNTQEVCHTSTTVKVGDITGAKRLIRRLDSDDNFYDLCSRQCKEQYTKYFTEKEFLKDFYGRTR